jgi:S-adenosylmethionine hydrolase
MVAPLITLTTDFGEGSLYVAEMKGVILSLQPEARIIDITHSIPPQDIRQGALALEQATPQFPPGSIHVAVVDPGVGTDRKIAYACIDGRHYISPDNGLCGLLVRRHPPSSLIALTNRRYWREPVSNTFHGRDIMAPAAAHLCLGAPPADLGEPLAELTRLDWPDVRIEPARVTGEICAIDSFGNLISNIEDHLASSLGPADRLEIRCCGRVIRGLSRTYGDASLGQCIALYGSNHRLEIAIVGGGARQALSASVGDVVEVAAAPHEGRRP